MSGLLNYRQGIINPQKVIPFFDACESGTQRVSIIGIGDSNQIHSANGWDDANWWGLWNAFGLPMCASQLASPAENQGVGLGYGPSVLAGNNAAAGYATDSSNALTTVPDDYATLPSGMQAIFGPTKFTGTGATGIGPHTAWYKQTGGTNSAAKGLYVNAFGATQPFCPTIDKQIRSCHWMHQDPGVDPGSAITFAMRRYGSPWSTFGVDAVGTNYAAVAGMARYEVVATEDASRAAWPGVQALLYKLSTATVGPVAVSFQGVDFPTITVGQSCSSFVALGGQSCNVWRTKLQAQSPIWLRDLWVAKRNLVFGQGQRPRFLVRMIVGLNDPNDTDVSNDGVNASNTRNGIYANMEACYQIMKTAYEAAGGNWYDEVFWEVSAAPDNGSADDGGTLEFARLACEAFSNNHANVCSVLYRRLCTFSELVSYRASSGTDVNHLLYTGHRKLSTRFFQAMKEHLRMPRRAAVRRTTR